MGDEVQTPTPETPVAPAQTTPAQTPVVGEAAAAPSGKGMVPVERFEAVVGDKYKAVREAEAATARALALEQENARLRAAPPQQQGQPPAQSQPPQAPSMTPAEIDNLTRVRADLMLFNDKCNESVAKGRKAYSDFDAAVESLRAVAPVVDQQGRPQLPRPFVEAALATGKGEDVLYALGKDTSEADRIMSLGPMAQAVELARMADKLAAKTTEKPSENEELIAQAQAGVSNAPAPVSAKVGAGGASPGMGRGLYDLDREGRPVLAASDWITQRQKEIDAKNASGGGRRI